MHNLAWKWRELSPLLFRATATAPLLFTLAPPRRAQPILVSASGAVVLKVAQIPSTEQLAQWAQFSWLQVRTELEDLENSADISFVYCSHPVKHPSCHASLWCILLSVICPVLHASCPGSVLSCVRSGPLSILSCILPIRHLLASFLPCFVLPTLLVLHWFGPTYVLSCICPVLSNANFNPPLLTRAGHSTIF